MQRQTMQRQSQQQKMQRQSPRQTLSARKLLGTLVLLAVLVYFGITFLNQQATMAQQDRTVKELEQKTETLDIDKKTLEERMEYQQSEGYIEYLARRILGWVKPGDVKFVPKD